MISSLHLSRRLYTKDTSSKEAPLDLEIAYDLSIVFLALSAYLVDQIDFSKWCYLTGVTINVLVSALIYYDTDIEDIDSIKWMVIGLLIELGCIGIHLFVKSYRRPISVNDKTTDPDTVCFE